MIIIIILGIILGIPYLAIGLFLALFAFDNPPSWIIKYHLEWIIFLGIIIVGPIILLGIHVWDKLTKNPKDDYLTILSYQRPLTKEDYKKSLSELKREVSDNIKITIQSKHTKKL